MPIKQGGAWLTAALATFYCWFKLAEDFAVLRGGLMADKAFHQENLARIENSITDAKVRLWALQERLQKLEDAKLDSQHTHQLIEVLIEYLALMEMRLEQTRDAIRTGEITGKTGCQNEGE